MRPHRPRRHHVLAATLLTTACAWGGLAGADPGPAPAPGDGAAAGLGTGTNLLVAGLDRRSDLTREEIDRLHVGGQECGCTDVLMLVHLAADGHRLSIVSLPRDSYVPFAPHDHPAHSGKINGAYAHGGADLTVRTVERATGLHIDHYLETDFRRFAAAVDDLGGADVCTDVPLTDENSGLELPAGTHTLDGRHALRYVRARHLLPPGDLGRVRRQQKLLLGMLARMTDAGLFRNPVAAARTARALLAQVRTDGHTDARTLVSLARSLRELAPEQAEFATVPVSDFDHRVPQWGSSLLWDERRAEQMFAALRADRPLIGLFPSDGAVPVGMPPSETRVAVDDPRIADALRASGFDVTPTAAPGARPSGPTVVTYEPERARYAPSLAAALPGAELRPVAGTGPVFRVVVGSADRGVTRVTYDRSMVEGAPVTGDTLRCPHPAGERG
ncbi:LCP family protein [Streptomyces sp. VRA16 Mangrove soil]|uniref:LCP family protein n=1 Tax=Streptomyces sp. VRA16 Mangrove soil TaxID=2817434 RepID=UPI001A9F57C2|nr:LCP family protein [Streptomyces sp. VRA16 Mangrove soil]MBO1332884.1 LCP family protein [Streptomyces sp. VRA16 Mangrove soil]